MFHIRVYSIAIVIMSIISKSIICGAVIDSVGLNYISLSIDKVVKKINKK